MSRTSRVPRRSRSWLSAALLLLAGAVGSALAQEAPPASGPPYRVGDKVSRPEIVSSVAPVYTELARRARVSGTVILEATIDEQGNVTETRILKGLPMGLDRAAAEAVKQWKFKPALLDGRPVAVYYALTVNFRVEETGPGYGPRFTKFLEEHPDFAAYLRNRHFPEAAELLDHWAAEHPADSEILLARTYLLLEQGKLRETYDEALSRREPEPFEVLRSVGFFALRQAYDKRLPASNRVEILDLGLQAETLALATEADDVEALVLKDQLLRQKAMLTEDLHERQALLDEAGQLQKRIRELRPSSSDAESRPEADHQP
jgi:TonB family protein